MKKLVTVLMAAACAGFLLPVDVSASTVKERALYKYGDSMGEAPLDQWSEFDHNFYGSDGKIVRSVQLYRSLDMQDINVSGRTSYFYDDKGLLVETVTEQAYATSPENADKEYAFKKTNHIVKEYNADGRLVVTYKQTWKEKSGEWDPMYKSNYSEYTYNADGTIDVEKYWLNYYSGNADKPSRVITYTYGDQGSRPVKTSSTGQYETSCYDTEYTYDDSGRLVHSISTYTKADGSHFGQVMEEKEYDYDGDFLQEVVTETLDEKKRVYYEKVNGDSNRYFEYSQVWNEEKEEWVTSSPIKYEHVKQDYAGMETIVPEISATPSAVNPRDMEVSFTLPGITVPVYAVKVFRDGILIKTFSKDELGSIYDGEKYYKFTDSGLKSGGHEYFAQVVVGSEGVSIDDYADGYISEVVNANVVIPYPMVTDFRIKGYELTKTWVEPMKDPDTGETIDGFWQEDYKLVVEWTPLTEEQVKDYGFKYYEIYYKGVAGNSPADRYTDLSTGSAKVDWIEGRYSEMWLAIKYGEDLVETEHQVIDIDKLTNLSASGPVVVYGVEYFGGYTPAFVKVDLSKPEEAGEVVYDLWSDSNADMSSIFGGVSVGNYYYALYDDGMSDGVLLGAFDMENKDYITVGKPYSDMETAFSDLAYDAMSDQLYAVVPMEGASQLYTIDRATGVATITKAELPEYTLYMASDNNGKLYAMAAEAGKFQLYTVYPEDGKYSKVEGVSIEGKQNTWSSLLCVDNKLYFNLNKAFFTINLDNNTVTTNTELKLGLSGITTVMSKELPEGGMPVGPDAHKLIMEQSESGMTSYFYNPYNQLERVSEFSAEGKMSKYTRHIHSEAGMLTTTEVYEPKVDEYGVESMQVALSSEYTYNESGLLAEKSNSDGSWERYTYDAAGHKLTESYGSGETTDREIKYTYDEFMGDNPVYAISSTPNSDSEDRPDDNYFAYFTYDGMGHKVMEIRTKGITSYDYTHVETWEYFPSSDILSAHNICSPTEFDEDGNPVVIYSTRYMMMDNDPNHMMSQEFDRDGNPVEGTARGLEYADYTDTAEKAFVSLVATEAEEGANNVNLGFSVPMIAYYGEDFSLSFYRDGIQIGELSIEDISSMMDNLVFVDEQAPNGKHDYFVRTNSIDQNGYPTGLQISPVAEIDLSTELPAVSDIAFVRIDHKYVDEEGNIDENANEGTLVDVVTIGWTNPEYPADYGFLSNNLFLTDGVPQAVGVVTDPSVSETYINVGDATTFNLMIQSRYKLGVANSDVSSIDLNGDGIGNVNGDEFTVKVEGKSIVISETAEISVFDLSGKRVVSAKTDRLDLSTLSGSYLVAAKRNGVVRIVKIML